MAATNRPRAPFPIGHPSEEDGPLGRRGPDKLDVMLAEECKSVTDNIFLQDSSEISYKNVRAQKCFHNAAHIRVFKKDFA